MNCCGRATETNLRRGVHGLLTQLFPLLKALLYRIQSVQAVLHLFKLEPWELGGFAVFVLSLMSAPMDAANVQLFAPFFANVVTGLLPSFTSLYRTRSLLLSSESEEYTTRDVKYALSFIMGLDLLPSTAWHGHAACRSMRLP